MNQEPKYMFSPVRLFMLVATFLAFVGIFAHAEANSYAGDCLVLPSKLKIVGFTNGLLPPTGTRRILEKSEFIKLLHDGIQVCDIKLWQQLKYEQRNSFSHDDIHCGGVFTDNEGHFYFWTLYSPQVFGIETSDGRAMLFQKPTNNQQK